MYRSSILRVALLINCALVALAPTSAFAALLHYTAFLEGAQEAPVPVVTPAKGVGLFTLDDVTGIFSYQIIVTSELLTSAETLAHVHGPAAPGATAPPVFDLPLGSPKLGTSPAPLTAQQQSDLNAGLWYVNVHTKNNPGGEIRGQIIPGVPIDVIVPEPPTLTLLAFGVLGCAAIVRLRRS